MDLYTNNIFVDKQESFFTNCTKGFFSYLYSKTMNLKVTLWLHYSTQEINIVIEELVKKNNNHFVFISLFEKHFFNRENYDK